MLTTVQRLFDRWNANEIRYCHWKSTIRLQMAVEGRTDIDILVDADQAVEAEGLALEAGFRRLETVPLRGYPGILDFVCLDDESRRWVHVHLHYQLVLGDKWTKAYWLPLEETVLRRATFAQEVGSYVVNGHDELYLFCARMALKHRRPFRREEVWTELRHIRERTRGTASEAPVYPIASPALDQLVEQARSTGSPSPRSLDRHVRRVRRSLKSFRRHGATSFSVRSAARAVYRYGIEFRRRIVDNFEVGRRRIPTGGLIVALVGIDGSGKSTLARRMEQLFAEQINTTRVFLGNGRSGASWYRRIIFALFGTQARFKRHRTIKEGSDREVGGKVPWYYALWIFLCLADKRQNLERAVAARANGSLVISDRWPQSQLGGTFDGPRLHGRKGLTGLARYVAGREREFLRHARAIRPDLVIELRTSPKVAYTRKPGEFSEAEARKSARLLKSIDWPAERTVTIDADRPLERVDRDVRRSIWQAVRQER